MPTGTAMVQRHKGPMRHRAGGRREERLRPYLHGRAVRITASVPLPTIAAVPGHASITTTAIGTTAIGAGARELVSRVWG